MIQCLSKEEVNDQFGSLTMFQKNGLQALIAKVEYLGGISVFDENKLHGSPMVFDKRPKGLIIQSLLKSKYQVGISDECFKYFSIEHKDNIVGKKDKSVIGRALIGGVLLGPVGALVGGMSGIGEKDIKSKTIPDNILTIAFDDEGNERYFCFSVSMKNFKSTEEYFLRHYKDKMKYLE